MANPTQSVKRQLATTDGDMPATKKPKRASTDTGDDHNDHLLWLLLIGVRYDSTHLVVVVPALPVPPDETTLVDFARSLLCARYGTKALADLGGVTCQMVATVTPIYKVISGRVRYHGKFVGDGTKYEVYYNKDYELPCIGTAQPYSAHGTAIIRVKHPQSKTVSVYTDARKFIADAPLLRKGDVIGCMTANTMPTETDLLLHLRVV